MSRILSLWPWGLGLLAIVALVGVVLSPVAALKLAREVGQFILERGRAVVKRLREVRDWWRVAAMVLGVLCLALAFDSHNSRRTVVLVQEQCQTRIVTVEREAEQAVTAAATTRRSLQQCKARLTEEVGKAVRAQELEREATAAAAAVAAQAERDREAWQRTYRNRPPTCRAALEAMEAACPTLSDY